MSYIKDNFGSRRGFYRFWIARLQGFAGHWRAYRPRELSFVQRLVFICNGNICRSPLAEFVAVKHGFEAISFGLRCTQGAKPDPRAVAVAAQNGIDLSPHKARQISTYEYADGDLIVGMEPRHLRGWVDNHNDPMPLTLLGLWGKPNKAYIHDPFNANEIYFQKCEDEIIARTKNLLQNIRPGQ